MKLENLNLSDIVETLEALDLAILCMEQQFGTDTAYYGMEHRKAFETLNMMRVAYMLLKRKAAKAVPAQRTYSGIQSDSADNRDSLSIWTESQYEASGQ